MNAHKKYFYFILPKFYLTLISIVLISISNLLRMAGRHNLMVMALDCGAGGNEFKPRRFQNIFDLMERFDETV